MLEWVWTSISLVVMIICISSDKTFYEEGIEKFPDRIILGLGAMLFVLLFSWPKTGMLFREWLHAVIPRHGESIHDLTVVAILGIVYMLTFFALPVSVIYVNMWLRDRRKGIGV
jgi:hypothetical protein